MVFTTYPLKGERHVTRAEIDRLTAIIEAIEEADVGTVYIWDGEKLCPTTPQADKHPLEDDLSSWLSSGSSEKEG